MTTPPTRSAPYAIFVLPALTMGGAEKQILTVLDGDSDALNRYRIELLTFLPATSQIIEKRFAAHGVVVHTIDRSSMSFPSFFLALWRFFRARRPDIVHTFLAGSTGTWGRLAAWLAGVPVLVLSDRTLHPVITRTQRLLEPLLIPLTARFITNAEATAQRLQRTGVPARKIHVLRNAVDLRLHTVRTGRSLREVWGVDEAAVIVGFLGMFRPTKRLDLLLDAMLLLPQSVRPDLLVLAGDGELMDYVRRRVEENPWLSEHTKLLGVVEDTPAFLQAVDVLVLTSDTEGLPNAMIEAMASGVPCVGTRVSDVPYLIGDERFLADIGDASSISEALRAMLELTPEERAEIGVALRRRAQAEFDLRTMAARFWELHADLWPGTARVLGHEVSDSR